MIDGITIKTPLPQPFELWRQTLPNIEFDCKIGVDSGEQRTKNRVDYIATYYTCKFQTYQLKVTVCQYPKYTNEYLTIQGSLHKNFYSGTNYQPFNWYNLQTEITSLCNALSINANKAKISGLEVGVNIVPPFEVDSFLHTKIINYKGKRFNTYEPDSTNFILGVKCVCSQYQVKIYNKGSQNKLPYSLLRIEKRFTKMQPLKKYEILYLSDLQKFKKVAPLLKELITMWNDVLIFETNENFCELNLKPKERELLLNWSNATYWVNLLKNQRYRYYRELILFKKFMSSNGNKWHKMVVNLIVNEWQQLLKNATDLPNGKKVSNTIENIKCNKFTYKINGKNVAKPFCVSCGNDISNQKSNSSFCSAKYVGEPAAKKCRNINSNTRNNFKGKLIKLESRGLLFDIKPYFINL